MRDAESMPNAPGQEGFKATQGLGVRITKADPETLTNTSVEDLEQNVTLHTLSDHAPTVLALGSE